MLFNKIMLIIASVGYFAITWKLPTVLRNNDIRMKRLYLWAEIGFGLTAVSYLLRLTYFPHGAVNIPAFVLCIAGSAALFASIAEGTRQRREHYRRPPER